MLTPRYYQAGANAAVWKYLNDEPGKNPLVILPTGAGKSLVIALLIEQARKFDGRVIVLQHRKELIEQNAAELRELMPEVDVGIYSAGLKSKQTSHDVLMAGIQSIYKRAADIGERHLIVIDECFTGETIIDTPMGKRRINNMRCGDTVYCASGVGVVKGVSSRPAFEIFTVGLSNGQSINCTASHKLFTENGWKEAGKLEIGEGVFSKQAVCALWENMDSSSGERIHLSGKSMGKSNMLFAILCEEIEKPDEQSSSSIKNESVNSRTDAQANKEGWKRETASVGSIGNSSCVGGGVGIGDCGSNWSLQRRIRVSDVLQDRHCQQGKEDWNRTGWRESLHAGKTQSRCEKNESFDLVRVVNISSEKRESPVPVFNLHVSGHPSYFANGVLVHNCHLVSQGDESMYGQFLSELRALNPKCRVAGLTATPFRTGEGPLCGKSKLFQFPVYEAFTGDLIEQGFLCPITNKPADAEVDTEGIKTRGGEFIESDMQAVFMIVDNVLMACKEAVAKCHDRKSILIFASGVQHAEDVAKHIEEMTGERVGLVTGETLALERSGILADFKNQDLRWLVNCDVLTTGFNAKCVDAIAIMRATMSPGLFCQMVGRGLRLHPSKANTLILDFGENIKRHGSIDDKNFGRASEEKRGQAARAAALNGRGKPCPACRLDVPANARECECGFIFPVNHQGTSDGSSQLTGQTPPEVWEVVSVGWGKHTKRHDPDAPPTLRIDYECQPVDGEGGLLKNKVSEWVCIEHEGFARVKACLWWQARSIAEVPDTVDDALSLLNRGAARMASQLTTVKDGKYTRIHSCEFAGERPEEWVEEIEQESFGEFSGEGLDVPF